MSSTALLKKFENEVEFTPVPGASNIHVIHPKASKAGGPEETQLTDAEWDKFEADIHEAFEQLP